MSDDTELTVGSEKSVKKTDEVAQKPTKSAKTTTKSKKSARTKALDTSKAKDAVDGSTTKSKKTKTSRSRKKTVDLEAFTALQEQIATNQKELLDSISNTFQTTLSTQLKRADRRRRWNNFFRDLIIVVLIVGLGYSIHLLYNLGYRIDGTGIVNINTETEEVAEVETIAPEPVKDDAWYIANYSYLLDQIKADLNADNVSAYYLYSNDYKISDIKPEYLLSIAYRQIAREQATAAGANDETARASANTVENHVITLASSDLKTKFTDLFGSTAKFYASNFSAGCLNFVYQHASETFEAQNQTCALNQHREIIEEIERIYQEGEVIYIISRAGIYDKDERSFYSFNDLFQPIAKDVEQSEFAKYQDQLNRYQYQFKKSGEKFYFNKITKLD